MLVPISWLNEFVELDKKNLKESLWKITEAGLTCENYVEKDNDVILDFEITPNRPDWMSVVGIAREISAISGSKLTLKVPKINLIKPKTSFDIKIRPNYKIVPRITSVIIRHVNVKMSPDWLKKRLVQIGLRPINNLVDITNYVLWMHGSLLHVFDYDKIRGHEMTVGLSKGGESFRSLDGIDYILPKNAIIIRDSERIIDLLPLKGGENSAATDNTKNVLLHSVITDPTITRYTSQALHLQSDSSQRAERGLDPNGTVTALNQALSLILELGGGEVASQIIDHSEKEFNPNVLSLNPERLKKVLGISIPTKSAVEILKKLNLHPVISKNEIVCSIPTFRQDLKIEEDLIEEVARVYGYNRLPKTQINSPVPTHRIAYFRDYTMEKSVKNMLSGMGFNEIYSYSLISGNQLNLLDIPKAKAIKVANPVSNDYEYLRPNLLGNLLEAIKYNQSRFENFRVYELGRIYLGTPPETSEKLSLTLTIAENNFLTLKGIVEELLFRMGIEDIKFTPLENDPAFILPLPFTITKTAVISSGTNTLGTIGEINSKIAGEFSLKKSPIFCELDFDLLEKLSTTRQFRPIAPTPNLIEDLSLNTPAKTYLGEIFAEIRKCSGLITDIMLLDSYNHTKTLRLTYHNPQKTLSSADVKVIRQKILTRLKNKFGLVLKTVRE